MLAFLKVLQPTTVEEAYEMAIKNKMAPLLAGGCWLRLGNRTWPSVIDLSGLDLRYVRDEEGYVAIGAMATQRMVETHDTLQQVGGGSLPKAVHEILGVQFRNMATMGGSVASRYGFSDIIPTLLAMQAQVVLHKGGVMSLADYMNYKERDILVEIRIPIEQGAIACEALRFSRGDFPVLTGAIRHDGNGYALYIGTRPGVAVLAEKATAVLNEKGGEAAGEAGAVAVAELKFQSNSHASAEYRKSMTENMVQRLVKEVAQWK